jgi:hypothetical protein
MKPLLLVLPLLCFPVAVAAKPASIVGDWRFPEETCANPLRIGPMSLASEDVSCRFASVKRTGNRVTWKGICDGAEGSSEQTVTATETKGRLTIRYTPGGNVLEGLVRCGKP